MAKVHFETGELFAWTPMEMIKVGIPMSVVLTLVWVIYALIKEKKTSLQTKTV